MSDRGHGPLIGVLASQLHPIRRLWPPWLRATVWLALCAVIAAILVRETGRDLLPCKMETGLREMAQFAGAAATAVTAAWAAFVIAVPGRRVKVALLPLPPLLLWIGASCWGSWLGEPAGADLATLPQAQTCFNFIVLMAAPLSAVLFLMLRRAFTVRPHLTSALAGLAAASAAAAMLDLVHPIDLTAMDLAAHLAAVLAVVLLNRMLTGPALRRMTLALAVAALAHAAHAAERRPVVVELFTSQGCSSCPAADSLLSDLARRRPDVLPLAFHVDYWNRLGWIDPFSAPAFTARQRWHASHVGDPTVYTPELVVEGARAVIGSDRDAVEAAIEAARAGAVTLASVSLRQAAPGLITIAVGPGTGRASVLLVGYDPNHVTPIGRGENGGRTLTESNIVRAVVVAGEWDGTPLVLQSPAPAGQRVAVLLERADGRIVGAATTAR